MQQFNKEDADLFQCLMFPQKQMNDQKIEQSSFECCFGLDHILAKLGKISFWHDKKQLLLLPKIYIPLKSCDSLTK